MENADVIKLYSTDDPAGLIPESELSKLAEEYDPAGATSPTTSTWGCAGVIVGISALFCPTTKCTSHCGT